MINFDFQKALSNLKGKIKTKSFDKGETIFLYRDWMILVFFTLTLISSSMIFSFYFFYKTSSPSDGDGGIEVSETFSRDGLSSVIKKLDAKKQKFDYLKANRPVAPTP